MTKNVIPKSENLNYAGHMQLLKNAEYDSPQLLDTAASILLHSLLHPKRCFFSAALTACKETAEEGYTVVGNFHENENSLLITYVTTHSKLLGIAAVRKLF